MGKVKEHGLLAVPKGQIISIRGGILKQDHQFCIAANEGPKWIAARTLENWEQIFALYAGQPGDHMDDPEYKADSGKREKDGKGRKIWLYTCRICGIKTYRHIYDHYRCVHAKSLPPCFFCCEPITKNNMWKHVTKAYRITVPKPLKSLSIKEVDLTAGAEGKANEILDQYPKAVLMLPFYHKDKHAGDIKPTEKQMAAKKRTAERRARAAAAATAASSSKTTTTTRAVKIAVPKVCTKKAKLARKLRAKTRSSAAAAKDDPVIVRKTVMALSRGEAGPNASVTAAQSSASTSASAVNIKKRRRSRTSDSPGSQGPSRKKQNGPSPQVARRAGSPIGKAGAERLKNIPDLGLDIATVLPVITSNPETKTARINMSKLPLLSIRLSQPRVRPSSQNSVTSEASHDKIKGLDSISSCDTQATSSPTAAIDDSESAFAEAEILDSPLPFLATNSCEVDVRSDYYYLTLSDPEVSQEDTSKIAAQIIGGNSLQSSIASNPAVCSSALNQSGFLPSSLVAAHKELAKYPVRKVLAKTKATPSLLACAQAPQGPEVVGVAKRPARACAKKAGYEYFKPTMVCGIPRHPAKCDCHWPKKATQEEEGEQKGSNSMTDSEKSSN